MEKEIDFANTMRQLLSEVAVDATGEQIEKDGNPQTWHEVLCDTLLKKGFKDANIGWKILQAAKVVSQPNEQCHDQAIKDYNVRLKKMRTKVASLLKKANIEDPALEMQIDLTARDWLAYEKACEDYASMQNGDADEQTRLSDQMRKWSATVRDDLTKLTMNAKDGDRPQTVTTGLDTMLQALQS